MAEQLLEAFEPHLASVKLVPSEGGVFEVMVDGSVVHSRSRSGRFPKLEDLTTRLKSIVGE